MSKMSELSLVVTELKRCGEALISISESLADLFSGNGDAHTTDQPKAEVPAPDEKPISLEGSELYLQKRAGPVTPPKFGTYWKSTALRSCRKSILRNIRHCLRKLRCWEMSKQKVNCTVDTREAGLGHALLSASSSHRWLNCPPSARLCENMRTRAANMPLKERRPICSASTS